MGRSLGMAVVLLGLGNGCALTTDLDRFEAGGGVGCDNPRNVCLRLTDFGSRADQLVQADIVTDGFLRARAVFDPIEAAGDVEAILPLSVLDSDLASNATLEVQVLADGNADRDFVDNDDTSWSFALPASGNLVVPQSTAPIAVDEPQQLDGDFTAQLVNMKAHRGQLFEMWVQEAATGRTAGYYRLAQVPNVEVDGVFQPFTIAIPGIIGDPGAEYRVQFYADFDDSGGYAPRGGNPAGDHSWVRTVTADDNGVSLVFDHTAQFEDLDIPESYGF